MREQTDEERVVDQGVGRLELPVVHVDDVGDFLERVERNAGRQQDAEHRDGRLMEPERLQRRSERVHEEVEVLERAEEAEIDDERQRQERAPSLAVVGPRDGFRTIEVDNRRRGDEREKPWIPPPVEDITGDEQHHVLLAPSETPVGERHERQKDDVDRGIEKHRGSPLPRARRFQRSRNRPTYRSVCSSSASTSSASPRPRALT